MKKCIVVLATVGVLVLGFVVVVFGSDLVWQDIGRGNLNLKTVLVETDNPQIIYIGSEQGIFKSEDGGGGWRSILSVRGTNRDVNLLSFALGNKNFLYAATGNGLYFSQNQGINWNRIFKGKNYLENECTALAILPSAIYLGTKAGLFVSQDRGRSWHKESGILGNSHILNISYNLSEPGYIYIASLDGVFKTSDAGKNWERIFVASPTENSNAAEEVTEDQDEEEHFSNIRYISIDPNNVNYLYLATSKGGYRSQDKGKSWEALSSYGLLNQDVRFILISRQSEIYAVTKSGVFEYKNERWHELSLGLTAEEINYLSIDNQGNLYAACDKGLFKTGPDNFSENKQEDIISVYYKDEPKINEVQKAAIKYAEVEPEKIKRWRSQAAKRALLPHLTVSMDRDNNRTASSSIGTYSGKYFVCPDDETKYDNKNWGISLTWELGDLIFSDDQTNIDVRSKLMVQLRPLNVHGWSLS